MDGEPPTGSPYGRGRVSRQRASIARAVASLLGAFTVDDLARAVREEEPGVGTATLYRAVSAMADSGHLEVVGERDGARLYAACDADGHHHHIVCTGCGRFEAAPCAISHATRDHAEGAGFVLAAHDLTLYGLCPACAGGGRRG